MSWHSQYTIWRPPKPQRRSFAQVKKTTTAAKKGFVKTNHVPFDGHYNKIVDVPLFGNCIMVIYPGRWHGGMAVGPSWTEWRKRNRMWSGTRDWVGRCTGRRLCLFVFLYERMNGRTAMHAVVALYTASYECKMRHVHLSAMCDRCEWDLQMHRQSIWTWHYMHWKCSVAMQINGHRNDWTWTTWAPIIMHIEFVAFGIRDVLSS